ncbi:mechanosensitive ion channel [Luteipulveratus flavus]|uniref:Mechanosensitive ion channel n=1 Tax=Luteipulveratus flavus TaxID=3031728 RepID=A0ABT6C8E6_9MICO|nr:mechanosensitive ion channel [Luteipulveratus sp. YIM 133296]MDF8265204.1 mechanosensitive ion channel [Luteipulveratus sp. YIM 133296]
MSTDDFDWSGMTVKVVSAIVILLVTWILAKIVKSLLSKLLLKVKFLNRETDGQTLASSLGSIGSLLVWLFGLIAILNLFALNGAVSPIQGMLGSILGALPRVLAAGLILFIGYVLAKIVRELAVTALQAANVDRFAERLNQRPAGETSGAAGTRGSTGRTDAAGRTDATARTDATGRPDATGRTDATGRADTGGVDGASRLGAQGTASGGGGGGELRISTIVGQILFVLVLAIVAISAFDALGIKAISEPATRMLTTILNALPLVLGAGILLAIGVVIARIVGGLAESLLRGFGVQRAAESTGLDTGGRDVASIGARIVQIAIVLFFAIAAARMLNFPEITNILNAVLELAGKVLFGAVVIAVGVLIANLLAKAIGGGQAATIIRYATIALFVAMGLSYMGLAESIVNLAFGAIVVGGAAAAALAFGLGGRDAAARQLERLQNRQGGPGSGTGTGTGT